MTREQVNQILADGGVDTTNAKLVVSALLNAFNDEKKTAVEEASKTAKEEAAKHYEGYVKPEDYKAVQDEIATLKDSSAKSTRTGKYKASGLKDKYVDLAEAKLKESKDFDKDLETFKKENSELFDAVDGDKKDPKPAPTNTISFGKVNTQQEVNKGTDLASAINEYYK